MNAYTLSMRSVVFAAVLSLSLSIGTLAAPRFHFELVKSSPTAGQKLEAAPARVQMWFSQPPAAGVSTITLKHGETDVELKKPVIDAKGKSITVEPLKPLTGRRLRRQVARRRRRRPRLDWRSEVHHRRQVVR